MCILFPSAGGIRTFVCAKEQVTVSSGHNVEFDITHGSYLHSANALQLPFASASVDVVLSSGLVEHIGIYEEESGGYRCKHGSAPWRFQPLPLRGFGNDQGHIILRLVRFHPLVHRAQNLCHNHIRRLAAEPLD